MVWDPRCLDCGHRESRHFFDDNVKKCDGESYPCPCIKEWGSKR